MTTALVRKEVLDNAPPSIVPNFSAQALSSTSIRLDWGTATDVGGVVTYYRVRLDGLLQLPQLPASAHALIISNLTPDSDYKVTVAAVDDANNEGPQTTDTIVHTLPVPPGADIEPYPRTFAMAIADYDYGSNSAKRTFLSRFPWALIDFFAGSHMDPTQGGSFGSVEAILAAIEAESVQWGGWLATHPTKFAKYWIIEAFYKTIAEGGPGYQYYVGQHATIAAHNLYLRKSFPSGDRIISWYGTHQWAGPVASTRGIPALAGRTYGQEHIHQTCLQLVIQGTQVGGPVTRVRAMMIDNHFPQCRSSDYAITGFALGDHDENGVGETDSASAQSYRNGINSANDYLRTYPGFDGDIGGNCSWPYASSPTIPNGFNQKLDFMLYEAVYGEDWSEGTSHTADQIFAAIDARIASLRVGGIQEVWLAGKVTGNGTGVYTSSQAWTRDAMFIVGLAALYEHCRVTVTDISTTDYGGMAWWGFLEHGIFGQRISAPNHDNWQNGVRMAEFENCYILMNPKGNGSPTVTLPMTLYVRPGHFQMWETPGAKGSITFPQHMRAIPLWKYPVGLGLVSVTNTAAGRIFQRVGTTASIPVSGAYSGSYTDVQARVLNASNVEMVGWTTVDNSLSGGTWSGSIPGVPQGGPYHVEVRIRLTGTVMDSTTETASWYVGALFGLIGSSTPDQWNTTGSAGIAGVVGKFQSGTWQAPTGIGCITFLNEVYAELGVPIGILPHGVGGTLLSQWNDGMANGNYAAFINAVNAAGGKLEGCISIVGLNDAPSVVSRASHLSELRLLRDIVRTATGQPTLPWFQGQAQRFGSGADAKFNFIHQAEMDFANDTHTYLASSIDLPQLGDLLHLTDAGRATQATRIALLVADALGNDTYSRGPYISGVSNVDSTHTDVSIVHRGGSDFTPTSSITGFQITDNGWSSTLAISAAVRQNATTIRLTHASAGGSRAVRYQWGAYPNVTGAVKDTTPNALPLEFNPD